MIPNALKYVSTLVHDNTLLGNTTTQLRWVKMSLANSIMHDHHMHDCNMRHLGGVGLSTGCSQP